MAHYRSVGSGYDINYVARFRLRARREFDVDDFFTIFFEFYQTMSTAGGLCLLNLTQLTRKERAL